MTGRAREEAEAGMEDALQRSSEALADASVMGPDRFVWFIAALESLAAVRFRPWPLSFR